MPVPPINPQDWFLRLLTQGLLHLQLLLVDSLFALLGRVPFFYRTDPALTVDHPAVAAMHTASLSVAGGLLGCLWVAGCLGVMARPLGLAGMTLPHLTWRLLAAAAAAVTARWWVGWCIALNNALCARVGGERFGPTEVGPAALARLLGMDAERERTFLGVLPTVGGALGQAVQAAYFDGAGPGAALLAGLLTLLLAVLVGLLALQLLLRLVAIDLFYALLPIFLVLGVLPQTAWLCRTWLRWLVPTIFLQAAQVTVLALGHEWLRAGYGDLAGSPGALLLPLLAAMGTLLLTLRLPALLAMTAGGAVDAAGLAAGGLRAGAAAVAAGRAWRR